MFPLNKKLSVDNILDQCEKHSLIINKLYKYTELESAQLEFIKSLGFNMYSEDSIILAMDNLEYVEHLAKKKGLI